MLAVTKDGERLVMDFPAQPPVTCDTPKVIVEAFGISPVEFRVKQLSARGGELRCQIVDNRVFISGKAVIYLEGKINIET
jgi:predicted PhzF superfamily epimerase YddE/YHI9